MFFTLILENANGDRVDIRFSINGDSPCQFANCVINEANFQSGHSGVVQSVAWSPNGKYILSGSDDCAAILCLG